VELVEEETDWIPERILSTTIVQVQVNWGEKDLAFTIKKNGGRWDKEKQGWEIAYGKAKELLIERRIVRK
jgi:hypothetical protein